jgi:hypothetical protein
MNEFKETYNFNYFDGEDRSIRVAFSPGDTWPEVLEQFVAFMSNVYGYNIREQVAIAENRFGVEPEKWSGPVFNPEDSL